MPDELKTVPPEIGNEDIKTSEVPPQGTRTEEFNKPDYTRKTQELAELHTIASQYGYDNPKELLTDVIQKLNDLAENQKPQNDNGDKLPSTPKELLALQNQLSTMAKNQAMLQVNLMYRDFKDEQKELSQEQRYDFSRSEIMDFIGDGGNASVVASVAAKDIEKGGDGNWCRIAADMLFLKKSHAQLVARGAKTQEALDRAAKSTEAMKSTAPPPSDKRIETPAMIQANRIAPDMRKKFE